MMLYPFVAFLGLSSALEAKDFGFDWQQVLTSLGLSDNNATSSSGCELAVTAVSCREIQIRVLTTVTSALT